MKKLKVPDTYAHQEAGRKPGSGLHTFEVLEARDSDKDPDCPFVKLQVIPHVGGDGDPYTLNVMFKITPEAVDAKNDRGRFDEARSESIAASNEEDFIQFYAEATGARGEDVRLEKLVGCKGYVGLQEFWVNRQRGTKGVRLARLACWSQDTDPKSIAWRPEPLDPPQRGVAQAAQDHPGGYQGGYREPDLRDQVAQARAG